MLVLASIHIIRTAIKRAKSEGSVSMALYLNQGGVSGFGRRLQETQILEDPFSAASMLIFAMHNVVFSECHIFSN